MIGIRNEHTEQCAVVDWARRVSGQIPELDLLFAVPNGAVVPNFALAQKLKSEGLRPGVPDLCLPVARGGYSSLFIEMKVGQNRPSKEQVEFIGLLERYWNKVVVCYGADEAIETIKQYLKVV